MTRPASLDVSLVETLTKSTPAKRQLFVFGGPLLIPLPEHPGADRCTGFCHTTVLNEFAQVVAFLSVCGGCVGNR